MKIVYATYIDNQEQIQYPINFILSKIPQLIVFCSDENNQEYLKSQGIDAKIIGVSIKIPGDISIAQNKCIDAVFYTESPDFVVWVQADIHITETGFKIIENFCLLCNLDKTCALGLLHIKLFHLCGFSYYGVNVIGRNAWQRIKFTGDGAYLGSGGADYCEADYIDATIDIGYLTIDQCRRHLRQHKITWNSDDNICDASDEVFVKEIVAKNNHRGLMLEGSKYHVLIEEMGLLDEYKKVEALCKI